MLDCPHLSCPGCPARDLSYAAQLDAKAQRLRAALARYPALREPAPEPIVGSPHVVAYRHRAKLPVVAAGEAVHVGLYAAADRVVVDTPGCPILHPAARAVVDALRAWLAAEGLAAPAGPVTSIDVRFAAAAGACQVTLACRGGDLPGGARAARRLRRAIPGVATVAVSRSDPRGVRVLGDAPAVLAGPAALAERIGERAYRLTPGAFFQVDPRQAVEVVRRVREAVAGARRFADLYCGVGTHALALAPDADEGLGVDEGPEAIRAARLAAADAGLEGRVRFVLGRAADVLAGGELARLAGPVEAIVLNPARRGSDPRTLEAIARAGARTIAYVSCDPDTLARDLDILRWTGHRPTRISPVDLFPQTFEVETVVALARGDPPAPPPADVSGPAGALVRAVALPPWESARPAPAAGAVFLPPPSTSGVAVLEGPAPQVVEALALVAGRLPAGGQLAGLAFDRVEAFAPGLSLVRLHARADATAGALADLARARHPVLGDPRGARTAPHAVLERAALVRPFFHVAAVSGKGYRARAPLHGDLDLALEKLRDRS